MGEILNLRCWLCTNFRNEARVGSQLTGLHVSGYCVGVFALCWAVVAWLRHKGFVSC
jgi:hypothetical protein